MKGVMLYRLIDIYVDSCCNLCVCLVVFWMFVCVVCVDCNISFVEYCQMCWRFFKGMLFIEQVFECE